MPFEVLWNRYDDDFMLLFQQLFHSNLFKWLDEFNEIKSQKLM